MSTVQSLSRFMIALALAAGAWIFALSAPAVAGDAYEAQAETSCDAGSLRGSAVRQGESVAVSVRSDAGSPRGEVEVALGSFERRMQLRNGSASFTVPQSLAAGRYDFSLRFFPEAGSTFKPCSVGVDGVSVEAAGDDEADRADDTVVGGDNAAGGLGNTGGFSLWILLVALVVLGAGVALVVRGRRLT